MTEWARAQARADRWSEELQLLCEEMRRTLAFTSHQAAWWAALAQAAPSLTSSEAAAFADPTPSESSFVPRGDPALLEGRVAYALEHVAQERALHARFVSKFRPVLLAAKASQLVPLIHVPEPALPSAPEHQLELIIAPDPDESDDGFSDVE
jgi:hypothetical protein